VLNIVIPMAGAGSRFMEAGYLVPKPLIAVHNRQMIELVINNLRPKREHRFIFLCRTEHIQRYNLRNMLKQWAGENAVILEVDRITDGAACTVLIARELIASSEPLMVANCDQYVDVSIDDYLEQIDGLNLDGMMMTLEASDPKWSYVSLDSEELVTKCVEKQVISNRATVGVYNFSKGLDFVNAADSMIKKNIRVNNEFYVAPVYNELIAKGQRIGIHNVGREGDGMYGLGIPSDLEYFLAHPISSVAR
jgi:NDP-sugar pyrophosphorylase family protein